MKGAISLIALIFVVLALGTVNSAWIGNADEETRICRSVCDKCGCKGFSCGEECLCECHEKKLGDKYMACITDARSVSPLNEMDYDIIVQGPHGNDRISRSILTREINPEQVFPSEHVFQFVDGDENEESVAAAQTDEDSDNVAAAAANNNNINRGWDVVKTLKISPVLAPPPNPEFRVLDRDEIQNAVRTHWDDVQKRLRDHNLGDLGSLPAHTLGSVALPRVSLPTPVLPASSLPNVASVAPPKPAAAAVAAPRVAAVTLPNLPTHEGLRLPNHSERLKEFQDFLSRPVELRKQLTIKTD